MQTVFLPVVGLVDPKVSRMQQRNAVMSRLSPCLFVAVLFAETEAWRSSRCEQGQLPHSRRATHRVRVKLCRALRVEVMLMLLLCAVLWVCLIWCLLLLVAVRRYDSRVKAMEVDEKPTEDYNDIGIDSHVTMQMHNTQQRTRV